ncbi:MAG: hemerythrin family protein [Candidatus Paceibacterota bacterium]
MSSLKFEWKPELSVGESVIDGQHQKLLSQVNKIISTILSGVETKDLEDAINFFDSYIKEHFMYEERYMVQNNYPNFEEHLLFHKDFIEKYLSFKKDLNDRVPAEKLIMEVEAYIGNWWLNHIAIEDKKYDLFISNKTL